MKPEIFKTAVRDGIDQDFVETAQEYGQDLSITSTQLRNVFSRVKTLQQKFLDRETFKEGFNEEELLLIQPRMDYAAARADERDMKRFADVVSAGIQAVENEEDLDRKFKCFQRFCRAFEAILAYHKVKEERR